MLGRNPAEIGDHRCSKLIPGQHVHPSAHHDGGSRGQVVEEALQWWLDFLHGASRRPGRGLLREAEQIAAKPSTRRSEEHTSELQSRGHLVCRLPLEKKKNK